MYFICGLLIQQELISIMSFISEDVSNSTLITSIFTTVETTNKTINTQTSSATASKSTFMNKVTSGKPNLD